MLVSKGRFALGAIALSFFFVTMSGLARAATITVDTVADGSVAMHCTLRDAISAANTKTATNNCVAGTGTDTIVFSVSGTITLGSTLPSIANLSPDSLAIDGSGQAITVDGAQLFQVFSVNSGATLYLQNLTIANGSGGSGGGIENFGTLMVSNSTISGNSAENAGGIFNDGLLTVTNSTFSGNIAEGGGGIENSDSGTLTVSKSTFSGNIGESGGGGIGNGGALTVNNSTFSGNSAPDSFGNAHGGGIANGGALTVTNSTFSGNDASGFGGGIDSESGTVTITNSAFSGNSAALGGGIYANSFDTLTVTNSTFSGNNAREGGGGILNVGTGPVTLTNSTFSGNSAASFGGGIDNGGTLTVTNSTFSGNSITFPGTSALEGGGIANQGTASVKGTILAGSSGGGNCPGVSTRPFSAPLADAGYNISDDNSCGFSGTSVNNSTTLHLDPLGLRNNGGPTQTIALEAGSDAIDAIPLASCTDQATPPNQLYTDQRGFGRPDPETGPGTKSHSAKKRRRKACDIGAYESGALPPVIYTGTVHGNLSITTGMTSISDATVTGNVTQTGGILGVSTSTIVGNLQINGGGTFTIDDSAIGGNLQVQSLPPGSVENQICGSEVKGDLQVHSNGAPITVGGMTSACPGNTIGNDLRVNNNTAAIEVFDDMIAGNLQCKNNTSITGSGDTAKSLQGQCASF